MKESPKQRMYKKVTSKVVTANKVEKKQDTIEVFVSKYYGLDTLDIEQKIVTTYADLCNLVAMYTELKEKQQHLVKLISSTPLKNE